MHPYLSHLYDFSRQLENDAIILMHTRRARRAPAPDGIVVVGMGGSGLPGLLLQKLAPTYGMRIPVLTWNTYGLPSPMPLKHPLIIVASFSGNTEEALSALRAALKQKGARVAVIASGGALKRSAFAKKLPLATFDAGGLTPREALGYTYTSLIKLLRLYVSGLSTFSQHLISPQSLDAEGKRIARALKTHIPLIYTDARDAHIGYVWKININETGKYPAFANALPELNHNEINGFERMSRSFVVLFLKNKDSSPEIQQRIRYTQSILNKKKVPTLILTLRGKTEEAKVWNSIRLSHFTAFYLAKLHGEDPLAIPATDTLKKLMAR